MENTSVLPPITSDPLPTTSAGPVLEGDADSSVEATFTCILIVSTMAANIFVGLTILRKSFNPKRLSNYFIVNLCVADILFATISMPVWVVFKLYGATAPSVLAEPFIDFWRNVDILCGTAAILSLASISLDRYLAITRPMTYIQSMTSLRAKLLIGTIWIYSTVVAFLRKPFNSLGKEFYAIFALSASFLLPSLVIIALHIKIFKVAQHHYKSIARARNHTNHEQYKIVLGDVKAARTIAVVIGTFVCCWLPFMVVSVCFAFIKVDLKVANLTKWLTYINALLNPLVYSFLDRQLRGVIFKRLRRSICRS